jgi:hypothetical protein
MKFSWIPKFLLHVPGTYNQFSKKIVVKIATEYKAQHQVH